MSASARFAAARTVRRQYPRAYASLTTEFRWEICAAPVKSGEAQVLGGGRTRLAAWRSAAHRLKDVPARRA
jgi:hypothetical protein